MEALAEDPRATLRMAEAPFLKARPKNRCSDEGKILGRNRTERVLDMSHDRIRLGPVPIQFRRDSIGSSVGSHRCSGQPGRECRTDSRNKFDDMGRNFLYGCNCPQPELDDLETIFLDPMSSFLESVFDRTSCGLEPLSYPVAGSLKTLLYPQASRLEPFSDSLPCCLEALPDSLPCCLER